MGFAIGGAVGLAVVVAKGRAGLLRQPPLAWAHGVGGLFGYHALYFLAFALAPAVEVNLINYLWPLLIVLLAAPIRGLRLGPARLTGVGLGVAGCALLVGPGAAFPPEAVPGFLAALGCAVVWSVYSVTAGTRRLVAVPTEAVAGFCLATAALAALLHVIFEATVAPTTREWAAVVALGLGPVGAAFFLWDIGMKRGDPRLLGTLAYAVPVASTLTLIAAGEGTMSLRVAAATAMVAGGGFIAARAR
jgi:drug/metabolite transporter (DMT)-like permease